MKTETRLKPKLAIAASIAAAVTLLAGTASNANAQWVPINDIDVKAGLLNTATLSFSAGGFPNGQSQYSPGKITFQAPNFDKSTAVLLKIYAADTLGNEPAVKRTPVLTKLMKETGQNVLSADLTKTEDPKFSLPLGYYIAEAQVYHLNDGYPAGYTLLRDVLIANGLNSASVLNQYPYSIQSKKLGQLSLTFAVNRFDVFLATNMSCDVTIQTTVLYAPRATIAQKNEANAEAAKITKFRANSVYAAIAKFSPSSPAPSWQPRTSMKTATSYYVGMFNQPVANNMVKDFAGTLTSLAGASRVDFKGSLITTTVVSGISQVK